MNRFLIDSEYTGPRWTYGFRFRPAGYGTCPDGFICQSDREHPDFRYGTRDWPHELTADDVRSFQLVLVSE